MNPPHGVDELWQRYLKSLPADTPKPSQYDDVFSFGDSAEMADELSDLVVAGTKTATAATLWQCETDDEKVPEVGDISVVLGGDGKARCIIETVEVDVVPYDEVELQFALDEGEGFGSIEEWREAHWRFWSRTLPDIGRTPSHSMPIVCERFTLVYPPSAQ